MGAWSSKRFSCFYSPKPCKVSTKMGIKIQVNILRLREVKLVVQGHTASEVGSRDFSETLKSLNLFNPIPKVQMGKLRTREGRDLLLQVTQETQGPTSQCRPLPLAPSQASPGKVNRTSPLRGRQAASPIVIPLPCWRDLPQRQEREVARRQRVSAAATGQWPLSAHQCPCQEASECQGESGVGAALLGPLQLWPGFSAKRRPRHTPKLLLSQISC